MDDFNTDPFAPSEIDKIQADIEKDLAGYGELKSPADHQLEGQLTIDSLTETEQTTVNEYGVRETVDSSVIQPDYGKSVSQAKNTSFFNETVKNADKVKEKGRFKRFVAAVCAISILGGLTAGIAIPIVGEVIVPRLISGNRAGSSDSGEANFEFVRDSVNNIDQSMNESLSGVPSFADLIAGVEPSVACITSIIPGAAQSNFFTPPTEFSEPHGGSGIIFDKDDEKLYIVTNNHVVAGATSVTVSINGSEDVDAVLVGREAESDLAVISVNIRDLQEKGVNDYVIAAFGNSESMRVGDFVIAIGNALGKGNTATFGFVSAVNKEINVDGRELTVIQTDAAINPGNSGGPLINLKGEVIGINMVKYVEASVEGTGYALTSDVAMPIIEQIRNQTAKPMLGIGGTDITPSVAEAYDLPTMGVIVGTVMEGSGAEKAGIIPSDIITSFDGKTVISMEQLSADVQTKNIGDKVEVKLIRNGTENITVTVTLAEYKDDSF
jgi:serine protease Do